MLCRALLMLAFIWPFAVLAQGDETLEFEIRINNSLSPKDVVNAALARSPDNWVIDSKAQYAQALSSRAGSFFSDTPEISINHQNDRFGSNQGLREWESSIDMPMWMPGQKSASRQKARMSEQEAIAYRKLVFLNVTGEVRELLWEIKLAKASLNHARNNLKLSENLARDISKRIEAGNLPRQNSLLSQKEIMGRKMELVTVEAEYIHAAREYESITGLSEMPAIFDEVINHETDAENVPIIELYDARVDYLGADYRENRSRWSSAPKLSVGIKRETGSFLDQNIDSFGIGISIPLGAGVHMTSKRSEAALALAEMERERELIKRQYGLQLHEAEHEIEVCEVQKPLSEAHFNMAKENLRLSQKAFDLGQTDLFDLLKIQEQYFVSSSDNTKITIECNRAVARHNQIKGVLLP